MINIQNILSVSKYERKTLYRSWFFRIFAIIALLVLFGMNMGVFGFHGGIRWTIRAIPANLPYVNILYLNVAQAIIAVFLASDFLRRDKKLDTTEVIYTRPVSNGEYIVGKTSGILTLFLGLAVIALLMALVFNLIRQDVPVVWEAYVYYILLISVPTLVFILGLSFLLMILIKNQAVTFVVLLGYIGLTLFYFKDKMHGSLDYMAFNLPMVYSDFIGFGDPQSIILHRLSYFLIGIGFIFATIRFLDRLPQVGKWNALNTVAFAVFVAFGGLAGYRYYDMHENVDRNRIEYLSLNNRYASNLKVDVVSNDLSLTQQGRKLEVSSSMVVRNRNNLNMDTLIFSLNPGFDIDSISSRQGAVPYVRDHQILKIIPPGGLESRRRVQFTIHYSGIPTEDIAYLDIPKETLLELKRNQVATFDKKPGIINRDFLLLTPELIWYPVAGVRFNTLTYMPGMLDFVNFSLNVIPNPGLIPVAPGKSEHAEGKNEYSFNPETDLNAFSIIIGPFEKRSLEYENVEYNLFLKPGHDYFSEFLTNIIDTIPNLIHSERVEYEVEDLDLYYPFKRISLVEVPIQFHSYERPQVQTFENIQPEIILMPEKGAGLSTLDFARYKHYEERRNRRENQSRTPREIEVRMFERFLSSTFFRSIPRTRSMSGNRMGGGDELIDFQGTSYETNPYCVFPLYYSYMTGISAPDFPMFNSMMELYLKEGFMTQMMQTFRGGMNDNEIANLALKENTISEIFADWDNTVTSSLISQIGSFVFLALKNRVGLSEFDNFLYVYLEDNAFREISFEQFSKDFYQEFEVEIEPYFETINTKGKAPTFLMSDPEYILTRDDIGEVYIVKFGLRNTGEVKGLIDVTFRMGGGFGGGGGSGPTEEKRIYELNPGVTRDIQIALYEQPRIMTVNTLISGNIPSTFSKFLRSAREVKTMDTEEYNRISDKELTLELPGEFVVDNEDPGFDYVSVSNESKLKQYIEARKEKSNEIFYDAIDPYRTPSKWTPVAHSGFYGESIRSAHLTRKGEGGNTASWTTILPAAGFYDVHVYIPMSAMFGRSNRRRRGGDSGQSGGGQGHGRGAGFADDGTIYNYVISSNEGSEKVEFRLRNIEDGWNKLGSFHFPADTARIEISNKTNGRRIFADAVKWVRR
ncbi:MAG TPA: hypothetical protein ENI20_18355 [Bacteroides sp.]|nr:hypothetical protein [Bacteroides sp.]